MSSMSKRFFAVAFALGLAAVAWVGQGFVGINWLALAMTAAIAGMYLLGAWELRQFRADTAALSQALDATASQPPTVFAEWLERVPPALRHAVRLRIEGERGALPAPALTPYLVGLLVMLGMLGTFLGMVVTFKGARVRAGRFDRPARDPRRPGRADPRPGTVVRHVDRGRGGFGHAGPHVGDRAARAAGGGAHARPAHRRHAAAVLARAAARGDLPRLAGPGLGPAASRRQAPGPDGTHRAAQPAAGRAPAGRPDALPPGSRAVLWRPRAHRGRLAAGQPGCGGHGGRRQHPPRGRVRDGQGGRGIAAPERAPR